MTIKFKKNKNTSVHEHNIPANIYEIFVKDGKTIGNFNKFAKILDEVCDHVSENRGLMEYYNKKVSVNAKVQSFFFEFEQIDKEVYGVAVCGIKAPLEQKELALLKDYITGQASDGFVEGLEQQDFKLAGRNVNISLWNYGTAITVASGIGASIGISCASKKFVEGVSRFM